VACPKGVLISQVSKRVTYHSGGGEAEPLHGSADFIDVAGLRHSRAERANLHLDLGGPLIICTSQGQKCLQHKA
jgi:hypothetical protein